MRFYLYNWKLYPEKEVAPKGAIEVVVTLAKPIIESEQKKKHRIPFPLDEGLDFLI